MAEQTIEMDKLLARALRGASSPWPSIWDGGEAKSAMLGRVLYHGVAGLLVDRSNQLADWNPEVVDAIRQQAVAQAMWELRHKIVLTELLSALDREGILAIILKGTGLAYDLYDKPSARARGDTDILISMADLARTRATLQELGFHKPPGDRDALSNLHLQEGWQRTCVDGMIHEIDLHWQALNSIALRDVFTFADCSSRPIQLPRLSSSALAMDRVHALVYACIHRAQHFVSPYFVGELAHFGGDRLIWAYDFNLLANALSPDDWSNLCDLAIGKGVADVCLDGLRMAHVRLGLQIPASVADHLAAASAGGKASDYLLGSSQAKRAWMDLRAVSGASAKAAYLVARVIPSRNFIRAKYPDMRDRSLARLYLRRLIELFRKRSDRISH